MRMLYKLSLVFAFGLLLTLSGWELSISEARSFSSIAVMGWQGNDLNPEFDAQLADCNEFECLKDLGVVLTVDKVLTGTVNKAGNGYKVALMVYDVKRKEMIAGVETRLDYPPKQLKTKMNKVAYNVLNDVPVHGKVTAVENGKVSLDVGSNVGLKPGKILRIIRLKEVWAGKRLLYMGEKLVAEIKISWVDEDQSEAKIKRSYVTVKQGDLVEIKGLLSKIKKSEPKKPSAVIKAPVASPPIEVKPKQIPQAKPMKVAVIQTTTPPVEQKFRPKPFLLEPIEIPEITTGTLVINTNPSEAEIILDGDSIGLSPKIIPDIEAGTHEIKLIKKSYRDWTGKATVEVGMEKKVEVKLEAYGGRLKIASIPTGASIIIGKKTWGKTNKTLNLPPGSYAVALVKKGYHGKSQRVKVNDGKLTNLSLLLSKKGIRQAPGMVYIPEGEFMMGSKKGDEDERPVHRVYVAGFYIEKYEVNKKEYQSFIEATERYIPDFWDDPDLSKPSLPVVGVTWEDSKAYCKWVGKRLPTEAEWEKAARGIDGRAYPWGDNYGSSQANAYGKQDGFQFTAPVDKFSAGASPFGVLNMSGNVWEWCADWYAEDYYTGKNSKSPQGPSQGNFRVIRGGSWEDATSKLRTTNRHSAEPNYSAYNLGFRCAK